MGRRRTALMRLLRSAPAAAPPSTAPAPLPPPDSPPDDEDLASPKRRIIIIRRQPARAAVRSASGFRSRTGWDAGRRKPNQDCVLAAVPVPGRDAFSLWAVLDGHGTNGEGVSSAIAGAVLEGLERLLPVAGGDRSAVGACLARACVAADRRILEGAQECGMSGSTGVFCLLAGAVLFCANVGDSRAVLGRRVNVRRDGAKRRVDGVFRDPGESATVVSGDSGSLEASGEMSSSHGDDDRQFSQFNDDPGLATDGPGPVDTTGKNAAHGYQAVPLSFDHTAKRPEEKARVIRCGGRIDAYHPMDDQAERVWLQDQRVPGLAVTRSFGDKIVKDIGVIALPEILAVPLSVADRFIVLASDGVFEFLSSADVVAAVAALRDHGTPQDAAEEIVKMASERWIDDGCSIDDISCAVVYLDIACPASERPQAPTPVAVPLHALRQRKLASSPAYNDPGLQLGDGEASASNGMPPPRPLPEGSEVDAPALAAIAAADVFGESIGFGESVASLPSRSIHEEVDSFVTAATSCNLVVHHNQKLMAPRIGDPLHHIGP